jgi:hypothetical protein
MSIEPRARVPHLAAPARRGNLAPASSRRSQPAPLLQCLHKEPASYAASMLAAGASSAAAMPDPHHPLLSIQGPSRATWHRPGTLTD